MKGCYNTNLTTLIVTFSFLFRKEWENVLFELGSERVKMHPRKVKPTTPSVHLLRKSKRKLSIVTEYLFPSLSIDGASTHSPCCATYLSHTSPPCPGDKHSGIPRALLRAHTAGFPCTDPPSRGSVVWE